MNTDRKGALCESPQAQDALVVMAVRQDEARQHRDNHALPEGSRQGVQRVVPEAAGYKGEQWLNRVRPTRGGLLQLCQRLGLTLLPLCVPNPEGGCLQHGPECPHPGKRPLVKWRDRWNPTFEQLGRGVVKAGLNWGVRCGPELASAG